MCKLLWQLSYFILAIRSSSGHIKKVKNDSYGLIKETDHTNEQKKIYSDWVTYVFGSRFQFQYSEQYKKSLESLEKNLKKLPLNKLKVFKMISRSCKTALIGNNQITECTTNLIFSLLCDSNIFERDSGILAYYSILDRSFHVLSTDDFHKVDLINLFLLQKKIKLNNNIFVGKLLPDEEKSLSILFNRCFSLADMNIDNWNVFCEIGNAVKNSSFDNFTVLHEIYRLMKSVDSQYIRFDEIRVLFLHLFERASSLKI